MNLKWSDIDLARGSILLQTTKNGERRFIPLVGTALDLLCSKYANQTVDSLVFPLHILHVNLLTSALLGKPL